MTRMQTVFGIEYSLGAGAREKCRRHEIQQVLDICAGDDEECRSHITDG